MRAIVLALMTLVAAAASAEEFVLIPIAARDIPGANGSIWRSSLSVTNHSEHDVYVSGIEPCQVGICVTPLISPKTTVLITTPFGGSYISTDDPDSLAIQLRVQDISRQAETWGTTIPTVRESQALTAPRTANLIGIPVTAEFRSLLRVYDFDRIDENPPTKIRVRFYSINPVQTPPNGPHDVLLLETTYELVPDPAYPPHWTPRMASIPLWAISELSGVQVVRIEVEPLTQGLRFWAFVSVTNNNTQHVTVICP